MAGLAKQFSSSKSPFLPVKLQVGIFKDKVSLELEIMIDTGFDGGIAIPKNSANLENLPFIEQTWTLADRTSIYVPVYAGYVQIGQLEPVITAVIVLGDQLLIGRHIINNFKLILDRGKKVIIKR